MKNLLLLALALALPAPAHEGEDHGPPPAPVPVERSAARAGALSPDLEAVATLQDGQLIVYLDRAATNEPLADARVEVESGAFKAVATRSAPGVFAAAAGELARPGRHALTLFVQAGELSDLLTVTLDVAAPPEAPPLARPAWTGPALWAAAGALILVAALLVAWRQRRAARRSGTDGTAALLLLAVLALGLRAAPVAAHGGEDHSHDAEPAPASAPVGGASAQRLPDGSVFMPKPMQYRLGLRHRVARAGQHPQTLEFNGSVVADPSASARVQATQAGRIEFGGQGVPVLGQRVAKGQLLATLRPSAGGIERGNQQALRVELDAQHALAQSRLQRLEQLDGVVPRKEVEAARIELHALEQRGRAIAGGLDATEALHAPLAGVVSAVHVVAGQVVDARETLIEIIDPTRLAVEALAYDPLAARDLADASAVAGGRDLPLQLVGAGRQLREQAMPLLFRLRRGDTLLAVGQPVKVIARTTRRSAGVALPRSALVRLASGETGVWVHAAAERFVPRRVQARPLDGATLLVAEGIADGERIVTEGASLLGQVR